MALIDKLTAIADAIRNKTGGTDELTLDHMAAEIEGIQTGVPINNQDKAITQNGQYKADSGYTGLGTVTVAVPETEPVLQDKELTENGTYTADEGFDGLGEVVVNVPASAAPVIQPLSVTANGTYEATDGVDGYNPVTVAIESGVDLGKLFGAKVATGSFIPSSNTKEKAIVDFGGIFSAVPYFFAVFENIDFSGGTINRYYCQITGHQKSKDVLGTKVSYTCSLRINDKKQLSLDIYGWDDSVLTKDAGNIIFGSTKQGLAGNEYFWIALGE